MRKGKRRKRKEKSKRLKRSRKKSERLNVPSVLKKACSYSEKRKKITKAEEIDPQGRDGGRK